MLRHFYKLIAINCLMSGTVQGGFVGLEVEDITGNNLGLSEFAVYATFDDPLDVLLGVQSNISVTTGFFHNTINGGQDQALPYTSEQLAMSDHPDADSFVTVGLFTGDNNSAFIDPNFDEDAFINGNTLGQNAGWGNSDPFNGQGDPDQFGRVLLAVFTPLNAADGMPGIVNGELTVGYSVGGPLPKFATDTFTTIPTPATLAVLGLGGALFRRKRR